jgi:ferredoxin
LDRLFTPHGPEAYFRFLRPGGSAPLATPVLPGRTRLAAVTVIPPATPTEAPAPVEQGVAIVRFARSGLEAAPEGTLLETAEAAGLTPRNRCRRGICGTCTTPKVAGTTRDLRTDETSSEPGPIRICVSVACDPVTLDL